MSNHAIHTPELIPVLKGEKYSRACGAEARHQAVAPFDGIAIDGVLFSKAKIQESMLHLVMLRKQK